MGRVTVDKVSAPDSTIPKNVTGIVDYKYAYLIYNISMKGKDKPTSVNKVRQILRDKNGILLASDLSKNDIPRAYLSILEKKGEILRVARGVYAAADTWMDEMIGLQSRYKNAVFSHETGIYLWELTDRTPLFYSVTVPSGYNATSLKAGGAKVYFIKSDLHSLGLTTVKSPHRNEVKTYNLERTICDMVRSRNQMDVQLVNEALKKYVARKDKNIDLLYNYALQFRIQKIIRALIEVLL